MKTRIGAGAAGAGSAREALGERGRGSDGLGFDSLWLSERLTGPAPDPLVALALAAGRTRRLKLGTSVLVVPGRNPVVLAKELASLDRLSGGRLVPGVQNKARQLGTGGERAALATARKSAAAIGPRASAQLFSGLKREGRSEERRVGEECLR